MISAKEARRKAEESKKVVNKKEMEKVEELISCAIEKGESEVTCGSISEETKQKLKELGYTVKVNNYYIDSFVDTYTTIRW